MIISHRFFGKLLIVVLILVTLNSYSLKAMQENFIQNSDDVSSESEPIYLATPFEIYMLLCELKKRYDILCPEIITIIVIDMLVKPLKNDLEAAIDNPSWLLETIHAAHQDHDWDYLTELLKECLANRKTSFFILALDHDNMLHNACFGRKCDSCYNISEEEVAEWNTALNSPSSDNTQRSLIRQSCKNYPCRNCTHIIQGKKTRATSVINNYTLDWLPDINYEEEIWDGIHFHSCCIQKPCSDCVYIILKVALFGNDAANLILKPIKHHNTQSSLLCNVLRSAQYLSDQTDGNEGAILEDLMDASKACGIAWKLIKQKDYDGTTTLFYACENWTPAVIDLLLAEAPNDDDVWGLLSAQILYCLKEGTVLHYAAEDLCLEKVKYLISAAEKIGKAHEFIFMRNGLRNLSLTRNTRDVTALYLARESYDKLMKLDKLSEEDQEEALEVIRLLEETEQKYR